MMKLKAQVNFITHTAQHPPNIEVVVNVHAAQTTTSEAETHLSIIALQAKANDTGSRNYKNPHALT